MSEEKRTRTIHPVVRVVDEDLGLVDYVASDETVDSYNEVILAKGWKFTHFAKNAPFLDSHRSGSIEDLLGSVESYRVKDGKLEERVRYATDAPSNHRARLAFDMVKAGHLRAVSVGFYPTKMVTRYHGAEFEEAKKKAGIDADIETIFQEQEQIELSQCVIGANPNALAKCAEADLVAVYGASNLPILEACSDAQEAAEAVLELCDSESAKAKARLVLATVKKRMAELSTGTPKALKPGQSAPTRAKADQSEGHAKEERQEFINEIRRLNGDTQKTAFVRQIEQLTS